MIQLRQKDMGVGMGFGPSGNLFNAYGLHVCRPGLSFLRRPWEIFMQDVFDENLGDTSGQIIRNRTRFLRLPRCLRAGFPTEKVLLQSWHCHSGSPLAIVPSCFWNVGWVSPGIPCARQPWFSQDDAGGSVPCRFSGVCSRRPPRGCSWAARICHRSGK